MKKPYLIAEIGINHNGNIKIAKQLEKQIKVVDSDILTFRGAILACNELIEENESDSEESAEVVVNDLDKKKNGG